MTMANNYDDEVEFDEENVKEKFPLPPKSIVKESKQIYKVRNKANMPRQ